MSLPFAGTQVVCCAVIGGPVSGRLPAAAALAPSSPAPPPASGGSIPQASASPGSRQKAQACGLGEASERRVVSSWGSAPSLYLVD